MPINKQWLEKHYPMFTTNSSERGFFTKFDPTGNLLAAQYLRYKDNQIVFETPCLEIGLHEAIFYATSGLGSRNRPEVYRLSDRGIWVQTQNPDMGGPELKKIDFEDWIKSCLDIIVEESELPTDANEPVQRSLRGKKSPFT